VAFALLTRRREGEGPFWKTVTTREKKQMNHNAKSVQRGRASKVVSFAMVMAIGSAMVGCGAGAAPGSEEQPADQHAEQPQPGEVSQALSGSSWEYEYYSDDTYTTLVGFWAMNCSGNSERYGTRTKYVIGERESCKTGATVGCWEIIDGREICGYTACVIC
jgi:hypothetical protein